MGIKGPWSHHRRMGVTDHFKGSETDRIHENMTYYCKTFINETRKRGIATFIWDNGDFGNGKEKFGIFDRKKANAPIKATWIAEGIKH